MQLIECKSFNKKYKRKWSLRRTPDEEILKILLSDDDIYYIIENDGVIYTKFVSDDDKLYDNLNNILLRYFKFKHSYYQDLLCDFEHSNLKLDIQGE